MQVNKISDNSFGISIKDPTKVLFQIRKGLPSTSTLQAERILKELQETGSDYTNLLGISLHSKKASDSTNLGFIEMILKTGMPKRERAYHQRRILTDKKKSIGIDDFIRTIKEIIENAEKNYIEKNMYIASKNRFKETHNLSANSKFKGNAKRLEAFYPKLKSFISSVYAKMLR